VDRAARNPNLLLWHGRLWLIDHGAALYLHHGGLDPERHARRPFPGIREHVLLPVAGSILAADERLGERLDVATLERLVGLAPDAWLQDGRERYVEYLARRLEPPRAFAAEAEEARVGA
jgi:hypothetical protein